ncbi:DUF2206 domain-containing protein [Haloplanus halobius]|uniref:DUF2206 domain-containing protein n=1 Tax=Haloplanus halobius TaxID=2934938 RepID=UPI00200BFB7F|nr:DUF2206 domain-containing protein [Haloplanus sp. XH21]
MATTQVTRTELFRNAVISAIAPNTHQSIRFSGFLTILYAVSVFLPEPLPGTTAIQAALGFVLLTFVPGLLILRIIRDRFRPIDMLYAVALSLAFSMFVAWLANAVYMQFQIIPKPFNGTTLVWIYVGVISVLTASAWYLTRDQTPVDEIYCVFSYICEYNTKIILLLLTLPVFGVSGALFINRVGENTIALSVLAACAVLPLLVLQFDRKRRYLGLSILAISFALVLQRALLATHLAFGDGMAEYSIAQNVLSTGYWIPTGTKGAMVRIGPMQAAYKLVMDIPLLWVFKIAHPVVFAFTPVIGYLLSTRYFSKEVAFLGSALYVFLPETYRLLPRNTRTGAAIFFTAVLVAVILDSDIKKRHRKFLALTFFWALITSHYGVGPLVLLLIIPAYVCYRVLRYLGGESQPMAEFTGLTLYVVLTFGWYAYITRDTFDFVGSVLIGRALNFLTPTTNTAATNAISFEMPSLSFKVFFYSHLIIAALTCLTIGIIALIYLLRLLSVEHRAITQFENVIQEDAPGALRNGAYLSVVLGLAVLFPLSFGPNVLSSARTFGLLMVILGPFAILAVRLPKFSRSQFVPASVLLIVLMLLSSGFIAATVTHDASRAPNFDRDRIMQSGDPIEQFALYRVYTPESGLFASSFIAEYIPDESTVYKSKLGTYQTELTVPDETDPNIQSIENPDDLNEGYTYIAQADTTSGTITTGFNGFVYYDFFDLPQFISKNKVYTNGPAKVYK